jgi:hypothetical protein
VETQPSVPHPARQQGQVVMRACARAITEESWWFQKPMRYQTHHMPIAQRAHSLE